MYISAALKEQGHDVKVLNYNLWDYNFEKEIDGWDTVMFTGFEEFGPAIIRDAGICKNKGIRTVVGGALATFKPEDMIKYVDIVVVGEGEGTVDYSLRGDHIVLTSKKVNLDNMVLPDYEGFGIGEYHKRHKENYMGVLTSRGCPHHCTFCAQTCKFQMRNLNKVWAEIDEYKDKYGVKTIVFNDNTINTQKTRFVELCKGMMDRKLKWGASIRVDNFDEEMAFWSKKSGCIYLVVGVESFDQDKLDRMNKNVKVSDIHKALILLNSYKIPYHGNVLVGFEWETYEDIIREVKSIPTNSSIYPCFVYPFVGTQNGASRNISNDQYAKLLIRFEKRINSDGKYLYPVGGMA
jgi:radical SAM superfamily enzyme YgiQ (UPF0313 family)